MSSTPLRRLLPYLAAERGAFGRAALLMMAMALATGAYAFLVGPALRFVFTGGAQGLPAAAPWAKLLVSAFGRNGALLALPLLLVVCAVVRGAAYFGQFRAMGMIGQRIVARLRHDFVAKLMALGPAFHSRRHSGDLIASFTSDMDHVERAATYAVASVVRDTLQVAVLLTMALWLDWRLSLIAFGALPLAAIPVARFARRLRRHADTSASSLGRLAERVAEGLSGLRVVQAYVLEAAERRRFDAETERFLTAARKAVRLRAATSAVLEILAAAGLAATVWLAARAVASGATAPERFLSFAAVVALLLQPARELGKVGPWFTSAAASGARLLGVLDAVPAVVGGAGRMEGFEREMAFEAVTFAYGEHRVLDGVSFKVRRGERVALVGASGAGKSTAASLLLRFHDPQSGRVTLDGVDLRDLALADARRPFALVTQEPLLFADTIRANILLSRPEADAASLLSAARAAHVDEFASRLPGGYDAVVGERGVTLSGGQRQRIAIARAVLSGAPVLVLDEATSNLDEASQREVQVALDDVLAERTALVIAHRLSTVRGIDRILVLKDGRLVEEGRHEELFAARGEYRRLFEQQLHVS